MARKLTAPEGDLQTPPAPKGHNSTKPPLTREEKAALLNHHIATLRAQEAKVELVRAPFKAAQEELTDRFNAAKADLGKGYSRKYLTALMEDVGNRLRNIAAQEAQRFQDRIDLGLPVFGRQTDLFENTTTDTERDGIAADADGYLAGRRADDPAVPAEFSIFQQEWMTGYHRGQAENAPMQTKAREIIDARMAPPPAPPEEFDEAKAARKLKKDAAFMDRSAPAEIDTAAA